MTDDERIEQIYEQAILRTEHLDKQVGDLAEQITVLLERTAELTGRLLEAEIAMGADGPISADDFPVAVARVIAERDLLQAVVRKLAAREVIVSHDDNGPYLAATSGTATGDEQEAFQRATGSTSHTSPNGDLLRSILRKLKGWGVQVDAYGPGRPDRAGDSFLCTDEYVIADITADEAALFDAIDTEEQP